MKGEGVKNGTNLHVNNLWTYGIDNTRSGPKIPVAAIGGGNVLIWSLISCYEVMR